MHAYIGLDIGGTKCAATLGTFDSEKPTILDKKYFLTEKRLPSEVLGIFSEFIEEKLKDYEIKGIGISCGGPLSSAKGVIMKPPSLPLWDNIEIVKYFKDKFSIDTYLQNDANACGVAEWKFGAGKGYDNVVFLTFGTGFGAGLILNGKLYSGANDNAGEIGHIRLTDDGPIGYYKAGFYRINIFTHKSMCPCTTVHELVRRLEEKQSNPCIIIYFFSYTVQTLIFGGTCEQLQCSEV